MRGHAGHAGRAGASERRAEKVLIADDDASIRRLMQVILEPEGFDILQASDGSEALAIARAEAPDLVVLDVMMPEVDGFDVCRALRSDPRTRGTSVIMLTAKAMSADVLVGLSAGADDYVVKPFHPVELLARVRSTLRRSRQMRDANPLTGLPGNLTILAEIKRRVEEQAGFALMHVDLDHFKAINDRYGFLRGDSVINLLAGILQDVVASFAQAAPAEDATAAGNGPADGPAADTPASAGDPTSVDSGPSRRRFVGHSFVGHVGGDDFAVVCDPLAAEVMAAEIVRRFDKEAPGLYDEEDRRRGTITVPDRRGMAQDFPVVSVSIGIATTAHRTIDSHVEAGEIAAEMKAFAKRHEGSWFAVDRRAPRPRPAASPHAGPPAPSPGPASRPTPDR